MTTKWGLQSEVSKLQKYDEIIALRIWRIRELQWFDDVVVWGRLCVWSPIRNSCLPVKGIWKVNSLDEAKGYLAQAIGSQKGVGCTQEDKSSHAINWYVPIKFVNGRSPKTIAWL